MYRQPNAHPEHHRGDRHPRRLSRNAHVARLARLGLIIALLVGFAPLVSGRTPVRADGATINFEDLAAGTSVSIEYQDSSVVFAPRPHRPTVPPHAYTTPSDRLAEVIDRTVVGSDRSGGPLYAPVVAHSGHNVLAAPTCGCEEFYGAGPLEIDFSQPQREVSLYTGVLNTARGSGPHRVLTLTAYDSHGAVADHASTAPLPADSRITTPLAVHATSIVQHFPNGTVGRVERTISRVVLDQVSPSLRDEDVDFAIDDLHYDNASTGPPPSTFVPSLTIRQPANATVLYNTVTTRVRAILHTPNYPRGSSVGVSVRRPDGSIFNGRADRVAHLGGDPTYLAIDTAVGLGEGEAGNDIQLSFNPPGGVSASDTVRVIVPPRPPAADVAPWAIEVNQAINPALAAPYPFDTTKTLRYEGEPLVAGKNTVVRLYGTVRGHVGPVRYVAARLEGYDTVGHALPGSPLSPVTGPTGPNDARVTLNSTFRLIDQRLNPGLNWNFVLPHAWTAAGTIHLRGVVNPDGEVPELSSVYPNAYANDALTLTNVTFFPTSPLQYRVRYFVGRLSPPYTQPARSAYHGAADTSFTNGFANSIMPVADQSTTVVEPPAPTFTDCPGFFGPHPCGDGDLYQNLLDAATTFWDRDRAADPSLEFHPLRTPYAIEDAQIVPQGNATRRGGLGIIGNAWVNAHAFAGEIEDPGEVTHESIHDLGLNHASNAHGEAQGGGSEIWPFCHGGLALRCAGDPDTTFRSAGVTDERPMGFDPSASGGATDTWSTARDGQGAAVIKDPIAHAPYPVLEPSYACRPSTLPPPTGTDDQMHYHDIISYGNSLNPDCASLGAWISTINYCRIFFTLSGLPRPDTGGIDLRGTDAFCKDQDGLLTADQLASLARHAGLAARGGRLLAADVGHHVLGAALTLTSTSARPRPGLGTATGRGAGSGVSSLSPSRRTAQGWVRAADPTLVIVAAGDHMGKLIFLHTFETALPAVQMGDGKHGDIRVALLDWQGHTIVSRIVQSRESSSHAGGHAHWFTVGVPLPPAASSLALEQTEMGRTRVVATVRRPRGRPRVAITAPRPGTALSRKAPIVLSWRGQAPAGARLTYDVLLSCDQGRTYSALAVGLRATTLALDPAPLCGGVLTLRVDASDGFDMATAEVSKLLLAPNPPAVTVFTPRDGAAIPPATLVTLSSQAVDPQAGVLDGAALRWRSDRDGPLGSGPVIDTDRLSLGVHRITLTATDRDGLSSTATVTLIVTRKVRVPPPRGTPGGKPTPTATAVLAGKATATPPPAKAIATPPPAKDTVAPTATTAPITLKPTDTPAPTDTPTGKSVPATATATPQPTASATSMPASTPTATPPSPSTAPPTSTPTATPTATMAPVVVSGVTATPDPVFYGTCANQPTMLTVRANVSAPAGVSSVTLSYRYVSNNSAIAPSQQRTATMTLDQKNNVYVATVDVGSEAGGDLQGTTGSIPYQVVATDTKKARGSSLAGRVGVDFCG